MRVMESERGGIMAEMEMEMEMERDGGMDGIRCARRLRPGERV